MKSVLKHTKATVFPDGPEEPKRNQQLWHEVKVPAATTEKLCVCVCVAHGSDGLEKRDDREFSLLSASRR